MKTLTLQSQYITDTTIVSNIFFDEYMPDANGEFVKIYLYLLRCVSSNNIDISISMLADKFNHTENDVMRALKYWAKTGLLVLDFSDADHSSSKKDLNGITLINPMSSKKEIAVTVAHENTDSYIDTNNASTIVETAPAHPPKPTYTATQLKKFSEKEELSQLLYISQKYLGKTLTPTETSSIIYFYETLQFPSDLIEYLIEYCVSREHKSMRYIEKVALSWAEAGISTVSAAKEESNSHNKNTYTVMKAFGISNRDPGKREREYITKWNDTYGFDIEIIVEACNRTIQKTHQPSFEYADSILSKWKEKNIRHLSELKELDQQFAQAQSSKRLSSATKPVSNNKFNNFPQREYDYDEFEKQLLNSNSL